MLLISIFQATKVQATQNSSKIEMFCLQNKRWQGAGGRTAGVGGFPSLNPGAPANPSSPSGFSAHGNKETGVTGTPAPLNNAQRPEHGPSNCRGQSCVTGLFLN